MMTEEDWDEDQSAVEVTRKLIDEGSKWNELLVVLNRKLLWNISPLIVTFYAVYLWNLVNLFQSGGIIPILLVAVLTPFAINTPFLIRDGYRQYVKNVARRNMWRDRFEILKKKEEELDKLLSGIEAG